MEPVFLMASSSTDTDSNFDFLSIGSVDNAVIYDRVRSAEEILFLADVTAPIDKPF